VDARFTSIAERTDNIAALYDILAEILATRTTAEWTEILDRFEIPNAPVMSLETLIDDPHLTAVDFFTTIPAEDGSELRLTGVPVLFDGQRPPVRKPPRLGEHSREILLEAGLPPEQVDALCRDL